MPASSSSGVARMGLEIRGARRATDALTALRANAASHHGRWEEVATVYS